MRPTFRMSLMVAVALATAAPAAGLEPADTFRDCPDCPEMVVIPAGSFTMGPATAEDRPREQDDGPTPKITIAAPFAMAVHEITVAQYRTFLEDSGFDPGPGCEKDGSRILPELSWADPGFPQADDHPVACVNFDDAKRYAAWLSEKTGHTYRLPTEAEWEYAARAGTDTWRYWGQGFEDQCRFANGTDLAAKAEFPEWYIIDVEEPVGRFPWGVVNCDDGHAYTSPVGSYEPNAFGLYDMLGNTWEWVTDCHLPLEPGRTDPATRDADPCADGIIRGGAWFDQPWDIRAMVRAPIPRDVRSDGDGMRVVRDLP